MTDKKVKGIICLHEPQKELVDIVQNDNDMEFFMCHFGFKKLG
jgi:hypothetical protein